MMVLFGSLCCEVLQANVSKTEKQAIKDIVNKKDNKECKIKAKLENCCVYYLKYFLCLVFLVS